MLRESEAYFFGGLREGAVRIRRITALLIALFLAFSQSPAFSGISEVDALAPKAAGVSRISFIDNQDGYGNTSYINGVTQQSGSMQVTSCTGPREGDCAKASSLMMNFIVPPCQANSQVSDMCVKALSFTNSSGSIENAQLLYEVATPKFAPDLISQTPAGGGISVWQGPSTNNSSGEKTYGVRIGIRYNIDYNPQTFQPGIAYVFGFEAEVIPVTFKSGEQYEASTEITGAIDKECAWQEKGKCAVRQEFGQADPISLTFQMDNRITGWLSGRMSDTEIELKQLSPTTNLLTVIGTPIDVPMGYADLTEAELLKEPDALKTFTSTCPAGVARESCSVLSRPQADRLNWQWGPYFMDRQEASTKLSAQDFVAFEGKYLNMGYGKIFQKYLKSYPVRNSQWKLLGLDRSGFREGNWPSCLTDKTQLNGVVTTNAMLNDVSPARFEDGSLIYDVAGAHEGYDGKVFKGTYDLVMNSKVARCLYKFTNAPIKASISILSLDGGVQNIATELVNERNGWLSLSAKNFTFSAPTIKITLFQDPAPSSGKKTGAANPSAQVKRTIICVKGKLTKKVTAVKPTCPKGYKKK